MVNEIGTVYSTNEYEMFKMIEGNRDCTEVRAKKIEKSIKENGYIMNPIIVNEKFEIIDGVGRFTALRNLNKPIVYVVQTGAGVKECAALNASTTKWTKMDYIRSYATLGNMAYINLMNVLVRYNTIPDDIVVSACYGVFTKLDNKIITEGRFDMTEEEMNHACDILSQLERFVDIVKKIPGRAESVYRALIYAIGRNDVNIERLYQKMSYRVTEFGQVADTLGALAGIEKIYNERLSDGRIYFLTEYDKDIRKSNPAYESRWGKQLTNRLGCIMKKIK